MASYLADGLKIDTDLLIQISANKQISAFPNMLQCSINQTVQTSEISEGNSDYKVIMPTFNLIFFLNSNLKTTQLTFTFVGGFIQDGLGGHNLAIPSVTEKNTETGSMIDEVTMGR